MYINLVYFEYFLGIFVAAVYTLNASYFCFTLTLLLCLVLQVSLEFFVLWIWFLFLVEICIILYTYIEKIMAWLSFRFRFFFFINRRHLNVCNILYFVAGIFKCIHNECGVEWIECARSARFTHLMLMSKRAVNSKRFSPSLLLL